jgi:UDP-glucose 4-epimerase
VDGGDAAGQPPVIFGTGADTMDFVHVEDIARANLLAATSTVTDRVFNIGTGVETSLNTLATTLLSVMRSPLRPVPRHGGQRGAAAPRVGRRPARAGFAPGRRSTKVRDLVGWWRRERAIAAPAGAEGKARPTR